MLWATLGRDGSLHVGGGLWSSVVVDGVTLAGKPITYSYVGLHIVGIFQMRREYRLTYKAVKSA